MTERETTDGTHGKERRHKQRNNNKKLKREQSDRDKE